MAGDSSQRGEVVVEIDPLLNTMEQKLRILESKSFEREESCTIYRVLPSIHGDDGAAYDPKIISICPYHWNNNQLSSTEEIKWQFLLSLINQNKENKLSKWLRLIRAQEPRARKLYSEKLELEPDAFVEMLVVDDCFIIELLVKLTLPTKNEQIFDENWKLPLIRSDILMLENQIPFFILQALFDSTVIPEFVFEDKNETPVTLVELALSYVTHGRMEVLPQSAKNVDILHLLHLFHMSLAPNPVQKESKPFSWIRLLVHVFRICKFLIYLLVCSHSSSIASGVHGSCHRFTTTKTREHREQYRVSPNSNKQGSCLRKKKQSATSM